MMVDVATAPEGALESSTSATSWGAIVAGAVVACATTITLTLIGTGLGFTMVSPWAGQSASLTTFAVSTVIWMIVVQWLSSGLGGYITGRLRTKWVALHDGEVLFRDTAHGLMAWALATLLVFGLLGSSFAGLVAGATSAVTTVASGAASGASAAASSAASRADPTNYLVDTLFRPTDPARLTGPQAESGETAAAQATRILVASAAAGEVRQDDRAYLAQLVASRAGLSETDARARVDAVLARAEEAKVKAKQAADTARKAAISLALAGALSLLIGAFVAGVAAAYAGRLRDEDVPSVSR